MTEMEPGKEWLTNRTLMLELIGTVEIQAGEVLDMRFKSFPVSQRNPDLHV